MAYLMVLKGSQIVDVSLDGAGKAGLLAPVVGLQGGSQLDYDRQGHQLFWLQSTAGDSDDDENCTLFSTPYEGGNKTEFFGAETGIVGAPSAIAFDWLGRNLYLGNKIASNIEIVRVDGKVKHRSIILANDGNNTSVSRPKAICLDPTDG